MEIWFDCVCLYRLLFAFEFFLFSAIYFESCYPRAMFTFFFPFYFSKEDRCVLNYTHVPRALLPRQTSNPGKRNLFKVVGIDITRFLFHSVTI